MKFFGYLIAFGLVITAQNASAKALVLALHGCKQDGSQFVKGSRLDQASKAHDFILLNPSQSQGANFDRCWNWFYSTNQIREILSSELSFLKNLVLATAEREKVDADKIYVIGMSAGAAMAANLAACYPEIFTGAALHSGIPYHANKDFMDVNDILKRGPSYTNDELSDLAYECAKPKKSTILLKKIIVFHGDLDLRNTFMNSQSLFAQFSGLFEKVYTKATDSFQNSETVISNSEEHKYTLHKFNHTNSDVKIQFYQIHGMAHAWSGGDAQYPNNDPKGPAATNAILDFFELSTI